FFQAEDGIRDGHVTGVQTCALPILPGELGAGGSVREVAGRDGGPSGPAGTGSPHAVEFAGQPLVDVPPAATPGAIDLPPLLVARSEERRVGKECRCGAWPRD